MRKVRWWTVALFFGMLVFASRPVAASRCVVDEPRGEKVAMKCNDFTFDATSSYDPNKKDISVKWDFGDGATSEEKVVKHTYDKSGEYTVTLTVTNGVGVSCDTSTTTQKVKVNLPPTADYTVSDQACCDQEVAFDASGSTTNTGAATYSWDFGDGTKAEGVKVTKVFKKGGLHKVRLIVDDGSQSACNIDMMTKTVRVNTAPVAAVAIVGKDSDICFTTGEEMKVNFDGTGSKDAEGDMLTYMWEFGDGATAQGAKVSHTYAAPGSYTTKLTVKDDSSYTCDSSSAISKVTVNRTPMANAGADEMACVNESVAFDGTGSTGDPGKALKYTWNFGDGSQGEGVSVKHSYAKGGVYKAVLTVEDGSGSRCAVSTDVKEISVDAPPVARLASEKTVEVGERVMLDASGSSAENGALKYTWDFGDGTVKEGGAKMTHVYTKGGTVTPRVTVEKTAGSHCNPVPVVCSRDMASTEILVNTPPVADAGPNLVSCGSKETVFDGSYSSDADGDTLTYKWNFGDGGTAEGAKVKHIYTKAGTYKVTLTVDDGRGTKSSKATDSFTATVLDKPVPVIKVR